MDARTNSRWHAILPASSFALALAASLAFAQQTPHVRMARLSFVQGMVKAEPAGLSEWAVVSVNTPIEQGYKLATSDNSYAEVQYEDASTVRVGESSEVAFNRLAVNSDGERVNEVELVRGYATFHDFARALTANSVRVANATVSPSGPVEFRADLEDGALRVEVFMGTVALSAPQGDVQVDAGQTLIDDTRAGTPYSITSGIKRDGWDAWVEQRDAEQEAEQNQPVNPGDYASASGSELYGWNDLGYYGAWEYFPGYGYGWCPVVSTGWSPYTYGRWAWYPRFGYTWISFEPWGWLPFHYGRWGFMSGGFGWAWFPGRLTGWSPATVNWYQGKGWIGWMPRLVATTGFSGCAQAGGCVTTMSLQAFQAGMPVSGEHVRIVSTRRTTAVDRPALRPTRFVMLPGAPVAHTAFGLAARRPVTGQTVVMDPRSPAVGSAVRIGAVGESPVSAGPVPPVFRRPVSPTRPSAWMPRPAPLATTHFAPLPEINIGTPRHPFGLTYALPRVSPGTPPSTPRIIAPRVVGSPTPLGGGRFGPAR